MAANIIRTSANCDRRIGPSTALSRTAAAFSTFGPISPVRAEKSVSLDSDAPLLRMRYLISNLSVRPLSYIWGSHPALQVTENTILRIPGKTGVVEVSSSPDLGVPGQSYPWPRLGATDMSVMKPASAGLYCGHHVTDLEAGWFALEDRGSGEGVAFGFPVELCPTLWLWMCYGGWRGYGNVVVVEPWTSQALRLDQAVAEGSSRRMEAGASFEAEIRMTPYRAPEEFDAALRRIRSS